MNIGIVSRVLGLLLAYVTCITIIICRVMLNNKFKKNLNKPNCVHLHIYDFKRAQDDLGTQLVGCACFQVRILVKRIKDCKQLTGKSNAYFDENFSFGH